MVHTLIDTTIDIDDGDGASTESWYLIKFAHDKVYMVVADVTSSSNAATVTIEPPLRTALINKGVLPMTVPRINLTSDVQEFEPSNDKDEPLFRYEFDVIESL